MEKIIKICRLLPFFSLFIVGIILMDLPNLSVNAYQTNFRIANFLTVVNVCLLIWYQTILVGKFDRFYHIKSILFKANALIPAAFFSWYSLDIVYSAFLTKSPHLSKFPGPIGITFLNVSSIVVMVFLIHAFITFFFINTSFVSNQIKKVSDAGQRKSLNENYLMPMKRLVKMSIVIYLLMFFFDFIHDIFAYSKL